MPSSQAAACDSSLSANFLTLYGTKSVTMTGMFSSYLCTPDPSGVWAQSQGQSRKELPPQEFLTFLNMSPQSSLVPRAGEQGWALHPFSAASRVTVASFSFLTQTRMVSINQQISSATACLQGLAESIGRHCGKHVTQSGLAQSRCSVRLLFLFIGCAQSSL